MIRCMCPPSPGAGEPGASGVAVCRGLQDGRAGDAGLPPGGGRRLSVSAGGGPAAAAVLESYLMPVWTEQQPLTRITRLSASGKRAHIADGYERLEPLTTAVAGEAVTWTERRLVVRSRQLVRAGETGLRARLTKARAAVAALNERGRGKPRFTARPALQAAVEAILTRYRVQGLLAVHYTERV